ncbi:MAG: DNA-formamidopyrimidine glycosylase family protein [Gemmatimonadales bacterium]
MPELPDILTYLDALEERVLHRRLERVRLKSAFVLRSVEPPISALEGREVIGLERIGKRIVLDFEDELFLVVHLMIAGRFQWKPPGASLAAKLNLAALDFEEGSLVLTEAGSKRRASLHVVAGRPALAAIDRGGLDPLAGTVPQYAERIRSENHTIKRTLTDPRLFDGIGNAYSDEILHAARLSPLTLTSRLSDEEIARLRDAARATLTTWIERFRVQRKGGFPAKVTAFRPEMAVHGKFGEPCPDCGTKVQRIRYADNETNYCARCQTNGRLLADRALSRLLKSDWPRSIDELD